MKLPAYPLFTIDPLFSIWAQNEKPYEGKIMHWCGETKALVGTLEADGETYRFLGEGKEKIIPMTDCRVSFLTSSYTFETDTLRLRLRFISPFLLKELDLLSTPINYMEYTIEGTKKAKISLAVDRKICCDRLHGGMKKVAAGVGETSELLYAKIGQKRQHVLRYSADDATADWGHVYLVGEDAKVKKTFFNTYISASCEEKAGAIFIAYDDEKSIEYFGEKLDGYWKKRFGNIDTALRYFIENREEITEKCLAENEKLTKDAMRYGETYTGILSAAYRQVLAGHKLVSDGGLLYLSKECHSNGCINTVDVSYPSMPLFLKYNPELVRGMLNGIFRFAQMPVWTFDFAPHDIGRYPIANGQAYALKGSAWQECIGKNKSRVFEKDGSVFNFRSQMPVEECGNMIIMSYLYSRYSGNVSFVSEHYDCLKKWANYLVDKGVVLENQLCTDDFAGRSEKNVNLAVKSVTGIACFALIVKLLGKKEKDYAVTAKQYADRIVSLSKENGYLNFSIGNKSSWSMKYNMAIDKLLGLGLFDDELYAGETAKYDTVITRYGVPLDSRSTISKTDWLMWASTLGGEQKVREYAECLANYLADCNRHTCFGDYFDTATAVDKGMNHRTVQGGLWFPLLCQ